MQPIEIINQLALEPLILNQEVDIDDLIEAQEQKEQINFKFYQPYPVFEQFHQLGNDASIRLLLAANRIGKTYSCLAEFAMHATATYPDHWKGYRYKKKNLTLWVGGITGFEAEDLSRRLFEGSSNDPAFIHESLVTYGNRKERRYKIKNANGGITNIAIKTYGGREQQNELSTWKAAKVDCILLDEQPTMSVFSECCMRIMDTSPDDHGMIIIAATCTKFTPFVLSFTERLERTEIEKSGHKVIDNQQIKIGSGEVRDGKVFLLAGWEDAEHLNEDQKKNMLANMSPSEIEARTKGMPSIGSGMVYPVLEDLITCEPFKIPDYWAKSFALDFGWNPSPTAAIFGAHDRDNDIVYYYAEYSATQLTPQHHALELMKQGCDWMPGVYDPAGKISNQKDGSKLVDLYFQSGICNLFPANNSKEEGVLTVLQRMMNGKLKIFTTLRKTLTELRMYSRDEDGIIIKGNDHFMDCMRYHVMSGLGIARTQNMQYMQDFSIQNSSSQHSWMAN
jgi:Terminase large subunit, T4likevirus-type, N-terminal/Terminase RNaseH-like domain